MTPELEPVWKQFEETYDALRDALSQLPDERLDWRPSAAAPSAAGIVAHIIRGNWRYSSLAAAADLPAPASEPIPDRPRMRQRLAESQAQVQRVFEQLSTQDLRRVCAEDWSPLGPDVVGPLDALWFCHQIVRHTAYHLGQINYISLLLEASTPG